MNEYQISYEHGKHGANEITGIDGINELKKTIIEVRKEGHKDIIIWKRINLEEEKMVEEKEEKEELEYFKVVFTVLLQANDIQDALERGKRAVQNGHESELFIEHL